VEALRSAGLKNSDIQALLTAMCSAIMRKVSRSPHLYRENLGLGHVPVNTYDGACASSSVAIRDAFIWIASGLYDIVLAGGMEGRPPWYPPGYPDLCHVYDRYYDYPSGITFPGSSPAAHLYAKRCGLEMSRLKEQMALISVKAHQYGLLNPRAHLRRELSVEKVLKSPMVCQPLQVYDCCPFSDGGAAVILASEEAARKLTAKPVFITASVRLRPVPCPASRRLCPG